MIVQLNTLIKCAKTRGEGAAQGLEKGNGHVAGKAGPRFSGQGLPHRRAGPTSSCWLGTA